MIWQYNPYAIPFLLVTLICSSLVVVTLQRRRVAGSFAFIVLLSLIDEWALADGLEFMSADLPSMLLWDKATYFGIATAPVACLIFVLYYTARASWVKPRNILLLCIIPGITLLLRWTDETYHLIYSQYGSAIYQGLSIIRSSYGNWFYVDVAYSYILLLFAISLLVRQYSRTEGVIRSQALILLMAIIAPMAVSVVDVLNLTDFPFDWTPLALTVTTVAMFCAVFLLRLFDIMPVAREALVRGMQEAVIVLDSNDRLFDINPAGERVLGIASSIIGKASCEILSSSGGNQEHSATGLSEICFRVNGSQRYFDLSFSDLRTKEGTIQGRIGILRDVTDRKQMEGSLRRRADQLAALQESLLGITGRQDLSVLLGSIVEKAAGLLDAAGGGLYLCDSDRQEARCVVEYNTKTNTVGLVLKYGEGSAGLVAQTGKPLIINDYRTWSNRAEIYEKTKPFGAVLSAPMIWRGNVTGVIHVLRYEAKTFTEADLELLTTFANHAAIAVENARLYEELDRHATQLELMVNERTGRLAESETRYRRLFDSSPISLWEEDFSLVKKYFNELRGRGIEDLGEYFLGHPDEIRKCMDMVKVLDVNKATLILYGAKSKPQLIGELRPVLTEESQNSFRKELVALSEGKTKFATELTNQTLTGNMKHVTVILNVVPGYEDTLGRIIVSIIDLTERRQMEEELRSIGERLEYTFDSNPAVIYLAKPLEDMSDYLPLYMSKNVVSIVGFKPEQFMGPDGTDFWASRVAPEDLAKYRDGTAKFWKEGHRVRDYRFLNKNGCYRWIMEEANVIRDSTGAVRDIIGYWTDITERKQLEDSLLKSQRLATVGELAAMVGHDLRNPLQSINTATYLLRNDDSLTKDQKDEILQLIDDNVEHSTRIIGDLLDYSREIRLTITEASLRTISRSALDSITIPENIQVQDESQDHPTIAVDSEKIRRVLINLITNSVEAMPNGGIVWIRSKISDQVGEISVSDTGGGLDQRISENLWKPLQTTKQKGMGLGLPICKRIIDAHEGEIIVENKAGEGTTFTIRLPIKSMVVTRA